MTFVLELLLEAVRNLGRHKLRSFLTALGIIFGIASVMTMVSAGEGAQQKILAELNELGITNIIVNAKKPPKSQEAPAGEQDEDWVLEYGLTFEDASQIAATVPSVVSVLPVHDVEKWIWFKSRRLESKVRGVTPEYFERLRLVPSIGRALTEQDSINRARVCVIRERLLHDALYMGDPLKLDLRVGHDIYRVVGVLSDFEFQSPNKAVLGIDDRALEIYVPFETVEDRFGLTQRSESTGNSENSRVELHQIVCAARDEDSVITAARSIRSILESFHDEPDYEVIVPLEQLKQRQETQRVFDIMMPIIAGISLLVGGIGILNIMLASITERTREIGIRRALGATGGDITWQFLVETVTLAGIGGLLGIAGGFGGVWLIERFAGWPAVVTPESVALSMGISCLTGVVFGLYPARRAAAMDPIEALRHE